MTDAYANKLLTAFETSAIKLANARTPDEHTTARSEYETAKAKVLRQMADK